MKMDGPVVLECTVDVVEVDRPNDLKRTVKVKLDGLRLKHGGPRRLTVLES